MKTTEGAWKFCCLGNYDPCAMQRLHGKHWISINYTPLMSTCNMAESSSEESLASLCREAEQLKVKIDEEKQKVCDLQRKFHTILGKASVNRCAGKISWNGSNASESTGLQIKRLTSRPCQPVGSKNIWSKSVTMQVIRSSLGLRGNHSPFPILECETNKPGLWSVNWHSRKLQLANYCDSLTRLLNERDHNWWSRANTPIIQEIPTAAGEGNSLSGGEVEKYDIL